MKRINFGCGPVKPSGWLNIDNDATFNPDRLSVKTIRSNSVDYIVAHHSLQCIDPRLFDDIMKDLYRVLKPGGILRVSIPDIIAAFDAYKDRNIDWFPQMDGEEIDERFMHYLTWYGQNINPITEYGMQHALMRSGFKQVYSRYDDGITHCDDQEITSLDTRYNESRYFEGRK